MLSFLCSKYSGVLAATDGLNTHPIEHLLRVRWCGCNQNILGVHCRGMVQKAENEQTR